MEADFPPFGIYVHVPYCRRRCPYCDFALIPVDRAPSARFTDRLLLEIAAAPSRVMGEIEIGARLTGRRAVSLYFGGGTPSMLDPSDVGRIVEAIRDTFHLEPSAEVTLEANPEDADPGLFRALRKAGINRLSLGVQAFDDRFLQMLGREHDAIGAVRAAALALANFPTVSLDLIFGTTGMSLKDWEKTLDRALALGPAHLSCYGLTVERGTELFRLVEAGQTELPADDDQATMYELAVEKLGAGGFPRYEVSNFASRGNRAVHNSLYWRYAEWLGFGPSAHSFLRTGGAGRPEAGGIRFWNDKNPGAWIEGRGSGGSEKILGRSAMGEMAFTCLRLADGLADTEFQAVFGVTTESVFGGVLARLATLGLLVRENGVTRLTDRGYLLSDSVFAELVS